MLQSAWAGRQKVLDLCLNSICAIVPWTYTSNYLNCTQALTILQHANDVFICKSCKRACSETAGDTSRKLAGVIKVLNTEASV